MGSGVQTNIGVLRVLEKPSLTLPCTATHA